MIKYSYCSKCPGCSTSNSGSKTLKYLNSKRYGWEKAKKLQLAIKQHRIELRGSTYTQIFFQSVYSLPAMSTSLASRDSTNCRQKTAFSIHGWESADAEGLLYTLFCVILYKGLELPWILKLMFRGVQSYRQIFYWKVAFLIATPSPVVQESTVFETLER